MTDPAITRLTEFTKRLGDRERSTDPYHIIAHALAPYFDLGAHSLPRSVVALCSDLTHVLAELEGAREALSEAQAALIVVIAVADRKTTEFDAARAVLARIAAQLRRDEEPK